MYGGSGDDHLEGGNYNDLIRGNAGNDLLIGRFGNDDMGGGEGDDDDILINGTISFGTEAEEIAALQAILAQWGRTDRSYALRQADITAGAFPLVLGSTVFHDSHEDTLTGGPGADWFFSKLGEDVLTDPEGGETVTNSLGFEVLSAKSADRSSSDANPTVTRSSLDPAFLAAIFDAWYSQQAAKQATSKQVGRPKGVSLFERFDNEGFE